MMHPPLADPVSFTALAAWCDGIMAPDRPCEADDPAGVWRVGRPEVRAVGLLLESWPGVAAWVETERLDAIIVHRPWQLPLDGLGEVGVLAYHLTFDERLTVGHNLWLAARLGIIEPEEFGWKEGRPIGMLGEISATPFAALVAMVGQTFGGLDATVPGRTPVVTRMAVAGAMTDRLVREVAAQGADLYLTGQRRAPARAAVEATGIGVVAVGHARAERWGMRLLAALLSERWPSLRVQKSS